jgi:hypothetical protein
MLSFALPKPIPTISMTHTFNMLSCEPTMLSSKAGHICSMYAG